MNLECMCMSKDYERIVDFYNWEILRILWIKNDIYIDLNNENNILN